VLGAARRNIRGWQLTERGMYWLMLMMSEFFGSVNAYRDAMRARVHDEQAVGPAREGVGDGLEDLPGLPKNAQLRPIPR
jgi:hypothetical protein